MTINERLVQMFNSSPIPVPTLTQVYSGNAPARVAGTYGVFTRTGKTPMDLQEEVEDPNPMRAWRWQLAVYDDQRDLAMAAADAAQRFLCGVRDLAGGGIERILCFNSFESYAEKDHKTFFVVEFDVWESLA